MDTLDFYGRLLIMVIIVIMSFLFAYMRAEWQKSQVADALDEAGATDYAISWRLFDFDKGNNTFDVSFVDRDGNAQTAICKIRSGFLFGSRDLFWNQPLG
jgi:hypothetical protein